MLCLSPLNLTEHNYPQSGFKPVSFFNSSPAFWLKCIWMLDKAALNAEFHVIYQPAQWAPETWAVYLDLNMNWTNIQKGLSTFDYKHIILITNLHCQKLCFLKNFILKLWCFWRNPSLYRSISQNTWWRNLMSHVNQAAWLELTQFGNADQTYSLNLACYFVSFLRSQIPYCYVI